MGLLAGPLCYFSIQIKEKMGFDDALDAFGVHGVGGVIGGILTGFFANKNISGDEAKNGLFYGRPKQVYIQLYGIVVVAAYSFVVTLLLLKGLDAILKAITGIGIRVTEVQYKRSTACSVLIACRHLACALKCASVNVILARDAAGGRRGGSRLVRARRDDSTVQHTPAIQRKPDVGRCKRFHQDHTRRACDKRRPC